MSPQSTTLSRAAVAPSRPTFGAIVQRPWAGLFAGTAAFAVLGTVAAVWPNPFFTRMIPISGYEPPLLALQSAFLGLFVAIRRSTCSTRPIGASSVVNFLGVACPICNKVLLFVFGATTLLTYFEPVRVYFAIAGAALGGIAVAFEARARFRGAHAEELAANAS